jgi:hypothetical protein
MIIEIIYLLSYLFKKVYIPKNDVLRVYCIGFLGNNSYLKAEDIQKCIEEKIFSISPKKDLKKLISIINKNIKYYNKLYKLFLNKKYELFIKRSLNDIYNIIMLNKDNNEIVLKFYIDIMDHYNMAYVNGKFIKVKNNLLHDDISTVQNILNKYNPLKCLEIGMTNNVILLCMLSNKKRQINVIVHNDKKNNVKESVTSLKEIRKITKKYNIIRNRYTNALLKESKKHVGYYDLIYIDNNEYRNLTLLDFKYVQMLLKKNGILIIGKTYSDNYLSNSDNYETLTSSSNLLYYKKINNL